MFKKALGVMTVAAVMGMAGAAMADDATPTTPTYYPPPYPVGKFVDNPYYKYYGQNKPDECSFDFNAYDYYDPLNGYNVKIKKRVIKEYEYGYPVYYILTTAKCAVPLGYKAYKRIVFKNFYCSLTDNSKYDEEETTVETWDSKFVVKKGAKYGKLSCKFKVEKEPYYHGGEPMDDSTDEVPATSAEAAPAE